MHYILQLFFTDSLGGSSLPILIACASPGEKHYDDTLNTLKFVQRARKVKNTNKEDKFLKKLNIVARCKFSVASLYNQNNVQVLLVESV